MVTRCSLMTQVSCFKKTKGLRAFHDREAKMRDLPIEKGPYAELLIKLSNLQERLPAGLSYSPIKIALVTARNAPADLRAIKTLREWGVDVDMAFFLGGLEKTAVLRYVHRISFLMILSSILTRPVVLCRLL